MAWLNIDKVTKKAVVHRDNCSFIRAGEKREEDGSWVQSATVSEAFESAQGLSGYEIKGCGHCIKR